MGLTPAGTSPVAALLSAAGRDWTVGRNEPLHVWHAEKITNGGRTLHYLVAPTVSELTDKILAAELATAVKYGP
jgi:hypothetical protein